MWFCCEAVEMSDIFVIIDNKIKFQVAIEVYLFCSKFQSIMEVSYYIPVSVVHNVNVAICCRESADIHPDIVRFLSEVLSYVPARGV